MQAGPIADFIAFIVLVVLVQKECQSLRAREQPPGPIPHPPRLSGLKGRVGRVFWVPARNHRETFSKMFVWKLLSLLEKSLDCGMLFLR